MGMLGMDNAIVWPCNILLLFSKSCCIIILFLISPFVTLPSQGVSLEQIGIRHNYNDTRNNLLIGKHTKLICQGFTGKQVRSFIIEVSHWDKNIALKRDKSQVLDTSSYICSKNYYYAITMENRYSQTQRLWTLTDQWI